MISIIIPVYNGQDWLADALESALAQTEPCEVIVVDDGNTDNSLEIAKKYQTDWYHRISVISQVNKGLASARNTGIMNATGDWILPLDADDILQDNAVEKILETIEKNPEADVIGLSFKTFGKYNENVILMQNPTLEDFKSGNRLSYCSAIRKSALLEIGGYSPKMTWGYEDLHLWINLLIRGKKIVTIQDVLMLYRTKDVSMITIAQAHHDELMAQIKKDFPLYE